MQNHGHFPGQQSDERVLYIVHPHPYAQYVELAKIYGLAAIILIAFIFFGVSFSMFASALVTVGVLLALFIGGIGTLVVVATEGKNIAYITDRRIVRFSGTTPFASNMRSLGWDEAVKVKTYAPTMFWKMLNIGTIVVHAKSTFVVGDGAHEQGFANDDLEINNVYFYQDLGNYIEKILYTFKHKPHDLEQIRPFVAKPRGQRD